MENMKKKELKKEEERAKKGAKKKKKKETCSCSSPLRFIPVLVFRGL